MTTTYSPARTEQAWLDQVRALMLQGERARCEQTLLLALQEHPRSFELRRILAGLYGRTGREIEAESMLRQLLAERNDDATAFTLASMLVGQHRSAAAAEVMRVYSTRAPLDPELAIRAIELLDDCGRKFDAATIASRAIDSVPSDPRLHAYAGMLAAQLGAFSLARTHYLYALEHAAAACEWHVPYGIASIYRYRDDTHPDFTRFRDCLKRSDLSDKARSTLLFALAKAHDDIGDFRQAAGYSRQANALAHALTRWSRKRWRRAIEARLNAKPFHSNSEPQAGFIPVFVVGMPRSGTTLVSELLSSHQHVRNCGEAPWLPRLAQQPELTGKPDSSALQRAAKSYSAQLRQDDSQSMRWFIDKQPLNFRYIDLALALFPNARVIYCQRDTRDNALSLWLQSFLEGVQGYAYDFSDIALVMHDCKRLMECWQNRYPYSVRPVQYENFVSDPQQTIAELATWLGIPSPAGDISPANTSTGISTASLWQARQPVYTTSVGRWQNYAAYLPELSRITQGRFTPGTVQRPPSGNNM